MWYCDVWGWVSAVISVLALGVSIAALVWSVYAWMHTWKELELKKTLLDSFYKVDLTKEGGFSKASQYLIKLYTMDPEMENPMEAKRRKWKKLIKRHPELKNKESRPVIDEDSIRWALANMIKSQLPLINQDKESDSK